jgi:hypothetical protein
MICHRPWFRLACVALLLLMAGLAFPVAAQARPLGEEPASCGAEPARLADIFWQWIADHLAPVVPEDRFVHLSGNEGWGMDPNGGKAPAPAPQTTTDGLP